MVRFFFERMFQAFLQTLFLLSALHGAAPIRARQFSSYTKSIFITQTFKHLNFSLHLRHKQITQ